MRIPDTHANDPGVRQSGIDQGRQGSIDSRRHLLLVGAGPGLGQALARRFAEGGYRVTLVARDTNGLDKLADAWLTPAPISTRSRRMPVTRRALASG
jgi:NADP-dependent 3-hydroxy acid dehydrogenase YdfG